LILEYALINPMEDESKKRGGARPGAGRKPGNGEGRKKGVFVALDSEQYTWVQEQPEGPPEYIRGLIGEDQKRRT